jgi:hypothetical protein
MEPCLVIVALDQPELFARLTALYAREPWIEIRLDRRQAAPGTGMGSRPERRSPPSPDTDLHDHGFIVIPRD